MLKFDAECIDALCAAHGLFGPGHTVKCQAALKSLFVCIKLARKAENLLIYLDDINHKIHSLQFVAAPVCCAIISRLR